MTDEPLAPVLRSWLRQRDVPAPESTRTAAHVLARLPRVRQRGRWWPLPHLGRGPGQASRSVTIRHETREMPIDRLPIITRRTVTMLSPVKAMVAGALVFALGGLFLVAQPFDPQDGVVPGAEVTGQPAATAIVTQDCDDIFATPIVCTWTADDPRLEGTLTHEWVADISAPEPDDTASIGWAPATLEGPDGSWTGHLYAVWGTEPASQLFVVLSGEGPYAGWQYVASTIDSGPEVGDSDWTGVIYEGEPPPFGPASVAAGD